MANHSVLNNSLRNKLTQLEYKDLSGKEKEIKKIYEETMGKNRRILRFIAVRT
ncbi:MULTISPECIES: hypothetical protein [Priestia]|jgi:hypothetical protein|uniref:hypothetical protein n=1 Tax=Priestia TaxID=2800373 RepID=UPI000A90F8B0|nr:hypothetical protein [Priestia megaterium]MCF8888101.1 hypothetical protein [Priestia megaterium]